MKTSFAVFSGTLLVAAAISAQAQLTNFQRLHSFGDASKMGTKPMAGLISGSDGWLYGTTSEGGRGRWGVVFKVRPDGSGYSVLHHFLSGNEDGATPEADLLEGSDGALYGTTRYGGRSSYGTAFKINKDGSGFVVLHHFGAMSNGVRDGVVPASGLIEASDGKLYGTTPGGGSGSEGTVFRINKDGTGYGLVHDFLANSSEGGGAQAGVVEGSDGFLYGVGTHPGTNSESRGTVFKVRKDGSDFTILKTVHGPPSEPANLQAGLLRGSDDVLYGASANGGLSDGGCIFKMDPDGQNLAVLRNGPAGVLENLIEGQDGRLYGTTVGRVFRVNKDGSDFVTLHQFQGGLQGSFAQCRLAQAPSGELFGTTQQGGRNGHGVIFSIQTDGSNYRILWDFSFDGGDARSPTAPLVEGPDGALYGTGSMGVGLGGAVFKIQKDGTGHTILRRFGTTAGDGSGLSSGVIVGSDGKLYGAAEDGGTNGVGVAYRLNRDGTGYQILHHFRPTDGQHPYGTLLQASDGFLYGVTRMTSATGGGAIFKLRADGPGFTTMRYLNAATDGADPQTALIEGSDGLLYGTTPVGGSFGGGTVFRISRYGTNFMVLRHFLTIAGEAHTILAGLLEGSDSVLYGTSAGTSSTGGGMQGGTVFKINKDGTGYAVLHHFTSSDRTLWPFTSLVEGRDGALYGATYTGVGTDLGAVYKLNKDGSGFMLVHEFSGPDGKYTRAPLLMTSDGAFYGAASAGGDLGFGTLFRIGHMIGLRKQANAAQLELTGVPGYNYSLQRSTDLQNWSIVHTSKMPVTARIEFTDSAPPAPAAFYRATSLSPAP